MSVAPTRSLLGHRSQTHERKRKVRNPERTRERLLQAAFREVHRSGFQSASIDAILAPTNVTKGALPTIHTEDPKRQFVTTDEVPKLGDLLRHLAAGVTDEL